LAHSPYERAGLHHIRREGVFLWLALWPRGYKC